MRDRHWRGPMRSGQEGEWWRQGGPGPPWWPGASAGSEWRGFGRSMLLGFVLVFALVALSLVLFLALLFSWVEPTWVVVVIAPVVVVLVGVVTARWAVRTWAPIGRIVAAAGDLADGDYTVRVDPTGSLSMRRMAGSFNAMAGRLADADEQRRRLLADLGHELRTPLTVLRGEVEAMIDGVHSTGIAELEDLLDEVAVMERLLEDLRTLSLAETGTLTLHPEPTDVGDLVEDIADSTRRATVARSIDVVCDLGSGLDDVVVDPVRLREIVANLAANAVRAMPDGGTLRMAATSIGSDLVIVVQDSGDGIPPDELDRVFERFHKGPTSPGSGIGLTISRNLAVAHGGTIDLESEVGVGTTATVRLPLVTPG